MNLTKPQKLIYDMEMFSGGAIATICGSIMFDSIFEIEQMKKAVNDLYRYNEALRIRIGEEDGKPIQYATDFSEKNIAVKEFDNCESYIEYAEKTAKEPMDIHGELCSMTIIILPDKMGVLTKMHHIIGDAWTLALAATQMSALLCSKEIEAYSYLDYKKAEDEYFESKRYAKDKEFWHNTFANCDEPIYLSEKQNVLTKTSRKTIMLDKDTTDYIKKYAVENNASLYSVFLTALAVYLNRIKGNCERFYIGTAVLNRLNYKEKKTMGMFINTVPVPVRLNNDETFEENMSRLTENLASVFRHQKYNYGDILSDIRKDFSFDGKLYDVMLSFQNAQVQTEISCATEWFCCGEQNESLQIHIDDRDNTDTLTIHYDYQVEKFNEYNICKLHEHMFNLLFDAINNSKEE